MIDGSGKRRNLQFRISEVIQFQMMVWVAELNRGEFPQSR